MQFIKDRFAHAHGHARDGALYDAANAVALLAHMTDILLKISGIGFLSYLNELGMDMDVLLSEKLLGNAACHYA